LIAAQEANQRRIAEERQAAALDAAGKAEAARTEAEAARAAAFAERERAQTELARIQAETAAATKAAEEARLQAEAARQKSEADRAQAEQLLADARIKQQTLASQAEEAQRRAQEAEAERARARADLMRQLNIVLSTKETARGLVVNMSDVLFDTGKATLKPGAREKLAKVAGILQTHNDLKLEVEGHTDSVGSEQMNQTLSEKRAASVREYLVSSGVQAASVTSIGKGETTPVATNDTAAGRQQNRRVEIVVSGDSVRSASN
jgi:outer membrane protein OmpA-like peptidoglycan-associated protein